ncbi:MAG: PH domain-containing protein [Clostridiaceae bacterium]
MQTYRPRRGAGAIFILIVTLIYNVVLVFLLQYADIFEISLLLKTFLVFLNLYQLYYLFSLLTVKYVIGEDDLKILSFLGLKKVSIPMDQIRGYMKFSGKIRGVRLSGYGTNNFAIGRAYIENAGTTYMYLTSSKNGVYIKTEEINYGLSPADIAGFLTSLGSKGIQEINWEYTKAKGASLFKDKIFTAIFSGASAAILILTLNPILLYITNRLPETMPLAFDARYVPVLIGTARQFAVQQMIYGFMNMAVLLCMFYASYFISRYDRKSAYKFICVPLAVSVIFLALQLNIYISFH